MTRWINAHEPAMTRPEAALLSALPPAGPPARLLTAPRMEDFRPVEAAETPAPPRMTLINRSVMRVAPRAEDFRPTETAEERPAQTTAAPRCGSAAGRAVLSAEGVTLPGVGGVRCKRRRIRETRERQDGVIPAEWL